MRQELQWRACWRGCADTWPCCSAPATSPSTLATSTEYRTGRLAPSLSLSKHGLQSLPVWTVAAVVVVLDPAQAAGRSHHLNAWCALRRLRRWRRSVMVVRYRYGPTSMRYWIGAGN